jgi:hypothetical protein
MPRLPGGSLRVAEAGLVIQRNVAVLADAAAFMLCQMGQDILLFGTAMAWRRHPGVSLLPRMT